MAERASVTEVVQLGPEVTQYTAVAATKRLQSMMIDLDPDVSGKTVRGSGYKLPAGFFLGKERSIGRITGDATYTEIIYPLSSLLKKITPTAGGATSKVWDFNPSDTAVETIQPFTVEMGSSVRAEQVSGVIVDSFGMKITRDEVAVEGACQGGAIVDPFTLTALSASAELPIIPILPSQVSVFMDPAWSSAGTTKLLKALETDWAYNGLWGPLWAINSAVTGPSATVGLVPTVTAHVEAEADAAGMAFLTNLRAGSEVFLQIKAVGPQIDVGPPAHTYALMITMALEVQNFKMGNRDGVRTAVWDFVTTHDPTHGAGFEVVVENALAAL